MIYQHNDQMHSLEKERNKPIIENLRCYQKRRTYDKSREKYEGAVKKDVPAYFSLVSMLFLFCFRVLCFSTIIHTHYNQEHLRHFYHT